MRHRRWIAWLAGAVVLLAAAVGCSQEQPDELDLEAKASFDYLWEQTNREEGSEIFGLTRGRYPGKYRQHGSHRIRAHGDSDRLGERLDQPRGRL